MSSSPQSTRAASDDDGNGNEVSYSPGEEGKRVLMDKWEGAVEAGKTAWEALPFTGDEGDTSAAWGRIWQGTKDTYQALDTLTGPVVKDMLVSGYGMATDNAELATRYGEEAQRTREAWGSIKDSAVDAWQEAEARNGTLGAI